MEKLVNIIQQFPLQERQYYDRNNVSQTFYSRGFLLTDGLDTFYAEAIGDTARSLAPQLDTDRMHALHATLSVREYRDKDGNTRYQTETRINRIS